MSIEYIRQTEPRKLVAYAFYSDFTSVEGGRGVYSWNNDGGPIVMVQGELLTSGIRVLYDSARLAVLRTDVVIRDGAYNEDVLKITFTVVYNKVTKYFIVYKDLKVLIDPKVLDFIDEIAFTQRFELDLANKINDDNRAFVHYFETYDANPNDLVTDDLVTEYQHPLTGESTIDVLQAYDDDRRYIFFGAFWPDPTEYSVYNPLVPDLPFDDGILRGPPSVRAVADVPFPPGEPTTPWVIVQWKYNSSFYPNLMTWLTDFGSKREFRFVDVFGMTDYNNNNIKSACDADDPLCTSNEIDLEVFFLINQVFNPEDLSDLVLRELSKPFQWIALGQSAATTDSAAAGLVAQRLSGADTFMLFDRNDTAFPWISPVLGMKGTIPYGLYEFGGLYYELFSNSLLGMGMDATEYKRTALKGFAFGTYDGIINYPPQPIAGGFSALDPFTGEQYWYPSISPLDERYRVGAGPNPYTTYTGYQPKSEGILSLGGMKANGITRYFNDFMFAITREGTDPYALIEGGVVSGTAPTSDMDVPTLEYFPVSTWNSSTDYFGFTEGYAVITIGRDVNGTRGLLIYGWDGRDTFWAAAWASIFLANPTWLPQGTVALILRISYVDGNTEPVHFEVVKALGTITELLGKMVLGAVKL